MKNMKNMKSIKYFLTTIIAGMFLFAACEKNEPIVFDDPSHAAFEITTKTVTVTDEITEVEVSVMLVGPHENRAFEVPFSIVDTLEIGTDEYINNVEEGNQIMSLGDKKVTIPANSSFGTFNIEFNHNNMDAGEQYVLTLYLEEGELLVSPAYNPGFALIFFK